MSSKVKISDIKILYGRSANKCNICRMELSNKKVQLGEMAHIIARNTGGARGDALNQNNNSYENLILLCPNHHTEVDARPEYYTIEKLLEIKKAHENFVSSATGTSPSTQLRRNSDVLFLNQYFKYTPFLSLNYYINDLPKRFHIKFFSFGDIFDAILLDLPTCYPLNDSSLQRVFEGFLTSYHELSKLIFGQFRKNGLTFQVYHNTNDGNYCGINKSEMEYDMRARIERSINDACGKLQLAYSELITYIRNFFPEIDMNSSMY